MQCIVLVGDGEQWVGRHLVHVIQDRLQAGAVLLADDEPAGVLDDLHHTLGPVHDWHAGEEHAGARRRLRLAGPLREGGE